ncbi:flagellar hook capping FlgD N-terminal domain-containing protein [Cohnella sp. AR92]|uniref:flagellar hook capping FlgD N-terminal domain-containing protein n=1 Tax=Cohnella sp. AR92 TaxID=648716 RepID=UPI000F8EACDA|nr:flagellar hook capping FlgD N-terminal domain-containing protein [Cohnella sp. AR92]RUS46370.1 flagellar hook capping protein [Cohnella sp. AR92]
MASSGVGPAAQWPYYSDKNVQTAAKQSSSKESGSTLGKDEFLRILITQLQNQDPMQPMEDKEFISQMAQFSALEQTMNMATQIQALRNAPGMVANMLGMNVTWNETDNRGNTVEKSGIVDSIVSKDGLSYARIGAAEIKVDEVTSIAYPTTKGSDAEVSTGE